MTSVYFIGSVETGHTKIGISANPVERLRRLQAATPLTLVLMAQIEVPGQSQRRHAQAVERKLHHRYARQHVRGEWFEMSDQLSRDIADIKAGRFDISALEAPVPSSLVNRILPQGRVRKNAAAEVRAAA